MKVRIPHLVVKPGRGGSSRCYWQPSAKLRAAGWEPVTLSADLATAIAEAKAWNAKVEAWRQGAPAATPREAKRAIKKFARRETVRELIQDFKEDRWPHLEARTRKQYQSALNAIDTWAGDQPLAFITAERCRVLLASLAKPAAKGEEERLHRAAGIGRVLRTLLQWAVVNERLAQNPMGLVKIREPRPRVQLWPDHCIEAFIAMADAMGESAIGTALLLAQDTGQREGDVLALTWRKLPMADGRRRIRLQQGKTKVWIDVPLTERLAARLEAVEAANRDRKVPSTVVLTRPSDGKAYPQEYFNRRFAEIRAAAIAGDAAQGLEPCPELEGLQFRDARRTIIVRLAEAEVDLPGIAAISGHKIEQCKKILETYLPRTGKMAEAAIDKLEDFRARQKGDTPAAKEAQA